MPAEVAAVFAGLPADVQRDLIAIRRDLLNIAAKDGRISLIDETLKWGEPAYRPRRPRTGTTIRLGWKSSTSDLIALYVPCSTDLIERFRMW